MGQVAFDTLWASEELETAGIAREQARAISLVMRKSHEVADVATRADITNLKHDLNADITDLKHDLNEVNQRLSTEIADVRKDLSAEIASVKRDIADVRKDLSAEIADVRKDLENRIDKVGLQLTVRLGGMLVVAVGALAVIQKFPL